MRQSVFSRPAARRALRRGLAIAALAVAAAAASAEAAERPVPVADSLKPGWWDFLAPAEPGLEARLGALLSRAGESAARLPPQDAAPAGQAMERLRNSLSALPGMLSARPAAPPDAPAPADTYTTRQILELDHTVRDLQLDLDERRSALSVTARALKNGQNKLDADFVAYMAQPAGAPARTVAGLEIMATRAEIAVTEAEQKLRQAESESLESRIRQLTGLRDLGLPRIVPDPERSVDQIRALIIRNQKNLADQRKQLLRIRAERSHLVSRSDAGKTEFDLADLRIVAAMVDEALLSARIGLYATELDWLAISAGGLDSARISALDARLLERRQDLRPMEAAIPEWVTAVERVIATSLRTPQEQLSESEARVRAALLDLAQVTITKIIRLRSLLADARFGDDVTVNLLAGKAGWRGWLQTKVMNPARTIMTRTDAWLGASLFRIGEAPVTAYGLLRIALFLLIAVMLSRILRHLLARFSARDAGRPSAGLYTVGRLLHYVLIAGALLIGLASIGLDFSQVALVAGALSIGIGFGLQSIVNNFVSGLMILFEQNLKVGDVVELDSGVKGVVREINVRSTLITTNDAVDIVVPNAEFISGKVTNFNLREPYHRIHVPFGVAYGSDKDEVRRVVIEAANRVTFTYRTAARETDVWLVRFGDNSLDFELVVWINPAAVTRPGAVMATYLWEIETALSRHGIAIPFPQRDVRLRVSAEELSTLARGFEAARE